ncbi:MAG: inositol monophosphatase family protein [Planctomycetota bacterium]|jgi:histidinol phosphatase-like enzyme (inositol monophosphatase family)
MQEDLAFAVEIARAAGRRTLEFFGRADLVVELKKNRTPVTEADRAAETLLRERIEATFPDDGIVGEEFGIKEGTSGRRWILDPIDGTKSFERGVPLYGTLVALEEDGEIAAGVIHMPALREEVHAAAGGGAVWVTGIGSSEESSRPASVSSVADPDRACVCATSPGGFVREKVGGAFLRLQERIGQMRGWGDCYGHLLVATGRVEAMVDPALAIWDAAPLKVVVEEAGGRFTDRGGNATHLGEAGISTNGPFHDLVLDELRNA